MPGLIDKILFWLFWCNILASRAAVLIQRSEDTSVVLTSGDGNNRARLVETTGTIGTYYPIRGTVFEAIERLGKASTSTAGSVGVDINGRAVSDVYRTTKSTEPEIIRAHSITEEEDPGFKLTTERLAYILIGSCCGLSILCLVIVAASLRCREHYQSRLIEKRWPSPYASGPAFLPGSPPPYHYTFARRAPPPARETNDCDSCRCTCGTWSLGASNLNGTTPLLYANKSRPVFGSRLPFGTASALHFGATAPSTMTSGGRLRGGPPGFSTNRSSVFSNTQYESSRPTTFKRGETELPSSSSSSSTSSYDPDFHPHCTCIEPPRRLAREWDLSPDSLETSDDTDDPPSWQACSYLVDTLHRHHPRNANRGRHPAQGLSQNASSWHHIRNGPRGVSWTSNRERLI